MGKSILIELIDITNVFEYISANYDFDSFQLAYVQVSKHQKAQMSLQSL